jgi:hypothetical protein
VNFEITASTPEINIQIRFEQSIGMGPHHDIAGQQPYQQRFARILDAKRQLNFGRVDARPAETKIHRKRKCLVRSTVHTQSEISRVGWNLGQEFDDENAKC